MPDPSAVKPLYESRRQLAWTALALWMLFALAAIVGLTHVWLSGRQFKVSAMEIILQPGHTPFTAGEFFAVGTLRAEDLGPVPRTNLAVYRLLSGRLATFSAAMYAYAG
jgi:hypothetical protein